MPTRSTSTATGTASSSSCGSARTSCCAGSATAGSSGPTSRSASTAATRWTAAFSATWEGDNALPTLAFGDYLAADREHCEDSRLMRPDRRAAAATPRRSRCHLATARCRCCSATGVAPASATCGCRTTGTTTATASEQLWKVEPGATPTPYTAADGWQPLQIWGMGIASEDITGRRLPGGVPDEPGRQQAADAGRRARPDRPTRTSPSTAASPPPGPTPAATCCRRPPGTPSSPTSTTTAYPDLFVSKGNVEAQEGYATRDPSNLLIGQSDGTFVEGAEDAGIVSYNRARGAALVDLNLDGLLDLVVVNRVEPVSVWRNVGSGDR